MIDPHHDLPVPNIDPRHKAVTDEELKRIKDSFPKHTDSFPSKHKVHSNRILDNLGITINLTELPEHKEYADYYLNRNRLVRWYLRTFEWTKLSSLLFQVQCAELNAIMEKGYEVISWSDE